MLRISDGNAGVDFLDQLLLLVIVEMHVPLGQSRFTSTILYKNKANLGMKKN